MGTVFTSFDDGASVIWEGKIRAKDYRVVAVPQRDDVGGERLFVEGAESEDRLGAPRWVDVDSPEVINEIFLNLIKDQRKALAQRQSLSVGGTAGGDEDKGRDIDCG